MDPVYLGVGQRPAAALRREKALSQAGDSMRYVTGSVAHFANEAGAAEEAHDTPATAALVRATLGLLADPAARRRLGEAGHARAVQVFDVQAMVRAFEAFYVASVSEAEPASAPALGGWRV